MSYRIKLDYIPLWGEDASEDTIVTDDMIEWCAKGWEKPVEEVLEQLEAYNFSSAVSLMDDDLRESLNEELAPCSESRFLWEYSKRHQGKYGEQFCY